MHPIEYMQLLQNVFMNSMENDRYNMVNEKCYLKEEIGQNRDSQKKRTPNGVYAFYPPIWYCKNLNIKKLGRNWPDPFKKVSIMKNGKDEVGTILDKRENAVFGSELEKNLLKSFWE